MAYKIIDIEGIGPVYAEKLIAAGIDTADKLLAKCAAPAGRKALEEETGISGKLILTWTNHADLYRVKGIGPSSLNCSRPPASTPSRNSDTATPPTSPPRCSR